jgi:hypothetical protein
MMKKLNTNVITSSKEKYKKIKAQFLANEILMNEIKEKKIFQKRSKKPIRVQSDEHAKSETWL